MAIGRFWLPPLQAPSKKFVVAALRFTACQWLAEACCKSETSCAVVP